MWTKLETTLTRLNYTTNAPLQHSTYAKRETRAVYHLYNNSPSNPVPWSPSHLATTSEQAYREAGLLRTKGTIFLLPPPASILIAAYNAPPRPKSRMSAGAVALCKHFERGGASSEHGRAHPYWALPVGGNETKTEIARQVLEKLWAEVVWRNVVLLHRGVAVYEVRTARGFGMRWTIGVAVDRDGEGGAEGEGEDAEVEGGGGAAEKEWKILSTTFRGFVDPIEGMDHELEES